MTQYGSIATSGALNPVPESSPPSPGSPDGSETGTAVIMARLSALEKALALAHAENRLGHAELEKVKKENGKLREAIVATQCEEEADTFAAVPDTGVPGMPESFLMTPQKPAASSPWTEGGWPTEWDQPPTDPPGFALDASATRQNTYWWTKSALTPRGDSWLEKPGTAQDAPATLPDTSCWTKSAWEREPWCAPAWGTT